MKNILKVLVIGLVSVLLIAGCAPGHKDMYYWGEYENMLNDMYSNPGNTGLDVQIEKLNTDIQQAADAGKPSPPGVYAHLGFLYASQGDITQAKKAFNIEKKLFPESATFINGMMKRAFKRG